MSAEPQRNSRRWRRIIVVTLGLAVLYGAYRFTLHFMVEAKLDAIRKQGYPVSLAELDKWYPQPPPGENAAEVYAEAFTKLKEWEWSKRKALPIVGQTNLPLASEPIDRKTTQLIEECLADNATAAEVLHRAAAVPSAKFPIEFERGYEALLPHLPKLRASGELLALDAALHAERGRPTEAVAATLACLAIDRALVNEPLVVSQLTRRRITSTALKTFQRVLARAPPSLQQLQEIASIIPLEEVPYSAPRALVGERCLVIDMFERIRTRRVSLEELRALLGGNLCGTPSIPVFAFPLYKIAGFLEIDELKALDIMNSYVAASQLPFEERLLAARKAQGMIDDCLRVWWNHFTAILIGPDYSLLQKDSLREAEIRVAIVGLQAEQYRLVSGSAPESLDQVSSTHVRAASIDPFDGQRLRYKKLAKGYVVYSVGVDGKDDGGDEKKDIVFTVER